MMAAQHGFRDVIRLSSGIRDEWQCSVEQRIDGVTVAGHGLGLFLSKGIVEAHGGRIWAESPGPGRGMSVVMVLPKLSHLSSAA
jgi:signal transduction histidine kinase